MMTLDRLVLTEGRIFSPEFYRRDFRDLKCAADFLEVSAGELELLLDDEYGISLQDFIRSMRIEDVKEHLSRINSREPLRSLAALYGFRSEMHLLWCFYRQEKCMPRRWACKMGCLTPEDDTNSRLLIACYLFAVSLIVCLFLLVGRILL